MLIEDGIDQHMLGQHGLDCYSVIQHSNTQVTK